MEAVDARSESRDAETCPSVGQQWGADAGRRPGHPLLGLPPRPPTRASPKTLPGAWPTCSDAPHPTSCFALRLRGGNENLQTETAPRCGCWVTIPVVVPVESIPGRALKISHPPSIRAKEMQRESLKHTTGLEGRPTRDS